MAACTTATAGLPDAARRLTPFLPAAPGGPLAVWRKALSRGDLARVVVSQRCTRALARPAWCRVELVLKQGGSIAAYATRAVEPAVPFWPLVFKSTRVDFLGSDDFPPEAKQAAATGLDAALTAGWSGPRVDVRYPLAEVAAAHVAVEERRVAGRVVLVFE